MQALFPAIAPKTLALNLDLATYDTFNRGRRRLAGALMGLIGLALLFPACAALATIFTEPAPPPDALQRKRRARLLALAETAVCDEHGRCGVRGSGGSRAAAVRPFVSGGLSGVPDASCGRDATRS